MKRITVPLPVSIGQREQHEQVLLLDTPIETVAPEEAPVAISIRVKRTRIPGRIGYRSHGGHLWQQVQMHGDQHHYTCMLSRSLVQNPSLMDHNKPCFVVPAQVCDPLSLDRAIELQDALSAEYLMIGGRLHQRSFGPLLICNWRHGTEHQVFVVEDGSVWKRDLRSFHLAFSAISPAAMEAIGPRINSLSLDDLQRHSALPAPDPDILAASAERALWNFLWRAHAMTDGMNVSLVRDVIDVRNTLEERWPGEKLDFTLPNPWTAASHLLRRGLPDPADLVPLLGRVSETSEAVWGKKVANTFRWVAAQIEPNPALELSGFSI